MLSGLYGLLAVLSHAECISSADKDTWKDHKHVLHADEFSTKKKDFYWNNCSDDRESSRHFFLNCVWVRGKRQCMGWELQLRFLHESEHMHHLLQNKKNKKRKWCKEVWPFPYIRVQRRAQSFERKKNIFLQYLSCRRMTHCQWLTT